MPQTTETRTPKNYCSDSECPKRPKHERLQTIAECPQTVITQTHKDYIAQIPETAETRTPAKLLLRVPRTSKTRTTTDYIAQIAPNG